MEIDELLKVLLARLRSYEIRMSTLEDRVGVMEENTISHETRLEEVEGGEWKDGYVS